MGSAIRVQILVDDVSISICAYGLEKDMNLSPATLWVKARQIGFFDFAKTTSLMEFKLNSNSAYKFTLCHSLS